MSAAVRACDLVDVTMFQMLPRSFTFKAGVQFFSLVDSDQFRVIILFNSSMELVLYAKPTGAHDQSKSKYPSCLRAQ